MSTISSQPDSGVPSYSQVGRKNRDLFLLHRNGVLVYCEDEGHEELYVRLLRAIKVDFHVEDVFCLGGKSECMKRLRENNDTGKKRVFLVDKDFDDLLNCIVSSPELVYTGRYSIENYFIDEDVITDFVIDNLKKIRRADVLDRLGFHAVIAKIVRWYENVVRHFVVARKFQIGVETSKLECKTFFLASTCDLNSEWWDSYLQRFQEKIFDKEAWLLEDGRLQDELDRALCPHKSCAYIADGTDLDHFPGKHLLDMIFGIVSVRFGVLKEKDEQYRFMATSASRLSSEPFAKLRLALNHAASL